MWLSKSKYSGESSKRRGGRELLDRETRFRNENGNSICSTLDEFLSLYWISFLIEWIQIIESEIIFVLLWILDYQKGFICKLSLNTGNLAEFNMLYLILFVIRCPTLLTSLGILHQKCRLNLRNHLQANQYISWVSIYNETSTYSVAIWVWNTCTVDRLI